MTLTLLDRPMAASSEGAAGLEQVAQGFQLINTLQISFKQYFTACTKAFSFWLEIA